MKLSTTQRAKTLLLMGKKLTVHQLDKMLSTNNSAEVIRRVRKQIEVKTEWKKNPRTGKRYGVYYHPTKGKVSRIQTRQYLNVGLG